MPSATIATEAELAAKIGAGIGADALPVSSGYQGSVHLVELDGRRFIVKTPHGRGGMRGRIRGSMLRKEYRVYQRLEGVEGVPRCYGLVGGRYLVLEHIDGDNLRYDTKDDRGPFFDRLLATIQELHRRGVAHGDLKKRDNIIMERAGRPFVVDFGVAVVRRAGFHPLNRFLFRLACSMDLNAWVKHKYIGYHREMTEADRQLLRMTRTERIARAIRQGWKRLRRSVTRSR